MDHKVALIWEFLAESFIGCSVHVREDRHRVGQFYRIVDDTSGWIRHRIFVSGAFFDNHAEAEIVPALQNLDLVEVLRMAGVRSVIVRNELIEIEGGA